ncbi:maleylpyruvate isomerase family mycothiol-dependent enzyme [Arthrobacter cheniae]|uniref:Maleylpyruvate isomerase family mycothiol-dependent enzyme n=1 Tax=Arthrobacter cheniae TaxID=1258888 RepID=A0A3A5MJL6_9MICC|nr:maleylpyruvate isomerase family mycothiol-dependent enzyme [Arthrobacter cheniae]RJT83424.1 maleylpyruvate isomerase family mycothiol-dependent enzyme [Arthrobacter cheniae]
MNQPSPHALPFGRYRELLDQDYRTLADLVHPTLDRPVPACPGWNGEDLVRHTAIVFLHKAETIRTGERPSHGWPPVSVGSLPPQALLAHCYARLVEQFDSHEPEDRAETWVPEDQTVGFWIRRLTHETSIHRFDLEDAAGGPVTSMDADLALDGIDEVLTVMLRRGRPDPAASGTTLRLETGGDSWDIRLDATRAVVDRHAAANEQAMVRADAEPMLLWLWGRAPQPASVPEAAVELRERLSRAL